MAYNLLRWERDQSYLMPPSMRDWLREGHLAWFIVDAVGQMDLRELFSVNYFCRRVASLRNVTETLALGVRPNQR